MQRRDFNIALCTLALSPYIAGAHVSDDRGPLFWQVTRGKGRVFLFGFAGAKDNSWLTPRIEQAFKESSELWLEVGSAPPVNQDPAAKQAADDLLRQLEHESGRSFFDVLTPDVRERALQYTTKLDIKKDAIETLRPWKAFYVINSAYWKNAKPTYQEIYVDESLSKQAKAQGKTINYEMPSYADFAKFMAAMSDAAQSQYIAWLLDFLDERDKGLDGDPFEWLSGHPDRRSLDRMRTKMPDLYQVMQVQRNSWWAAKIDELLNTQRTYFIGIGMLHVLGPDGIPQQLLRRRIVTPHQVIENPSTKQVG